MNEDQNKSPSPRAEVEQHQKAIDFVRRNFFDRFLYLRCSDLELSQLATVIALAQERVAELSRRAEAAEQDEIAWRGGP